jgi:hypothetical protein
MSSKMMIATDFSKKSDMAIKSGLNLAKQINEEAKLLHMDTLTPTFKKNGNQTSV